jgi:hypothetical protein
MIASSLVGGLFGTLILTTIIRLGIECRLTRMDLALLLGTVVTQDRRKARAFGYLFYVVLGVVFAFGYNALFTVVGSHAWWLGALVGAAHAIFLATVIVVLLPVIHPLMGTAETAANEFALIEPPGFLMLNYGRSTFLITLAAHMVYGAVVASTFNFNSGLS